MIGATDSSQSQKNLSPQSLLGLSLIHEGGLSRSLSKSNLKKVHHIWLEEQLQWYRRPRTSKARKELMSSKKHKTRVVDWSKFTNFSYRRSKEDLSKLCSKLSKCERENVFKSYDNKGLCPIHWAAINNRSDMIEFMIDNGCPIEIKCKNKLFADGTSLHLAAMNGSIEAASILLKKADSSKERGKFKKLSLTDNKEIEPANNNDNTKAANNFDSQSWLKERDVEGQTPLMRSAAPRSKRLDTIRDLLRKNLWSLSGRPAEMALFLINKGADWRETEPIYNMNLMHLAIVNDYDDIVNLLLVIDRQLLEIPAKIASEQSGSSQLRRLGSPERGNFETVSLDENSPESQNSSRSSLLDEETRAKEIIQRGLKPLELAIVYGRLSVIQLFWFVKLGNERRRKKELRALLSQVCWSSKTELFKIIRVASLKIALIGDLTVLTLYWLPFDGVLLLSYLITIALAIRMIFSDPGYSRQNTHDYLSELSKLIKRDISVDDSNFSNQTSQTSYPVSIQIDADDVTEKVRVLCHKCHNMRKARSRHCDYCNKCVQDFDHHCIYLSCCVGRKNRCDFLIMIIMLTLTATYGTVIYMEKHYYLNIRELIGFWWIFKYVLIGLLIALLKLKRACQGVTMYENLRSKRIRKIFGSKGPPESISNSHRAFSVKRGSFWRYSPDRFVTGDLKMGKILKNLQEFTNNLSIKDYLLSVVCGNTNISGLFLDSSNREKRINSY